MRNHGFQIFSSLFCRGRITFLSFFKCFRVLYCTFLVSHAYISHVVCFHSILAAVGLPEAIVTENVAQGVRVELSRKR